ncbi:MAG: GlxA family transcriptional regulator [Pararhodobacter sp.]|nr:GlxA family transcriptional regulator [Pararhodobacter sp.]
MIQRLAPEGAPDKGLLSAEIQFLLMPRFSTLGLALLSEPLFLVNWLLGRDRYSWCLLSMDGAPVRSSDGQFHQVSGGLTDIRSDRATFVLASFEAKAHCRAPELAAVLREAAYRGTMLSGVETGSEALAHAGLLDGRRVAAHWDAASALSENYPEIDIRPTAFEIDGRIATSAGALANLDLMLNLIAETDGQALAEQAAGHLLHHHSGIGTGLRVATPMPREGVMNARIQKAVRIMEETLEEPVPVPDLARRLQISQRQIERDFRTVYGMSPSQFYRQLRLNLAHRLLQQTNLSVTEVAVSAGFGSAEHFSRAYSAEFGIPPSRDRLQSTDAPVSWMPNGAHNLTLRPNR